MSDSNNITLDEARGLVSNQLLWPRIRDFLWDFAPQVHPSWLEGLGFLDDLERRSGIDLLESYRVKCYILNSLGVEPCFHPFPKDDGSRLLLLDGKTLVEILKWLGALVCADELRKVTDGATVRALRAALPGVYPEVFGYTAYFKKLKIENEKCAGVENVGEHIVRVGCSLLFALVGQLPKFLRDRLRLKLPKSLSLDECPDSQLSTFNFRFSNLQLLLKLRFPEAYSLCCS